MAEDESDSTELGVPWERNFRDQMARLRKERGLTQTDLARQLATWGLPFHQQTVQRIENGQRPVRLNEAKLIARELEVSLDTMMSTTTASGQSMMRAVDEARRGAGRFADVVNEELEDLANSAAQLTLLVGELLEHRGEDSNGDPALDYGFAWANHVWDLYVLASEALTRAAEIEKGHGIAGGLVRPEFEVMRDWFDKHDHLFSSSSEYPKFPEQDEPEA
ncbi:helix-turn-helix transcriptional regulator [Mycobacteroides abscessus]|uniref:helix-turn-helix transcriptional regulator n=1 Tax=Mycobacteroides abscessus TaxID=36809 RepID=UPI0003764CA3|nr:helix-turn-helix transcriptional regulator [Mycobacteroides abscessus]